MQDVVCCLVHGDSRQPQLRQYLAVTALESDDRPKCWPIEQTHSGTLRIDLLRLQPTAAHARLELLDVERGRITALGTHSELMATVPAYRDLLASRDDQAARPATAINRTVQRDVQDSPEEPEEVRA